MRDFKARWKLALDQLDLWLVSYEINVEYSWQCNPLILVGRHGRNSCREIFDLVDRVAWEQQPAHASRIKPFVPSAFEGSKLLKI